MPAFSKAFTPREVRCRFRIEAELALLGSFLICVRARCSVPTAIVLNGFIAFSTNVCSIRTCLAQKRCLTSKTLWI